MLTNVPVDTILDDLERYGHTEWAERLRKNLELALDTLDTHWQSYVREEIEWMKYKQECGVPDFMGHPW